MALALLALPAARPRPPADPPRPTVVALIKRLLDSADDAAERRDAEDFGDEL